MAKVTVTCQECGKDFEVIPAKIQSGRGKYCSISCRRLAFLKQRMNKEKGKCLNCGKEFEKFPSEVKRGIGKFCNHKCQAAYYKGKNNPSYKDRIVKKCQECGKEIRVLECVIKKGGGKYCSKQCADKAKSRLYSGENSPGWVEKIIRKCRTCGKEFPILPLRVKENRGYYCSKECYNLDCKPEFKRILKKCKFCGKEFQTKPTTQRPDGRNYCSRECFLNGAGQNFACKRRIEQICPVCGKAFETFPMRIKKSEILYCSRKCYATDQSRRFRGQDHPRYKEKVKRVCQTCGKAFETDDYRVKTNRGIYCCKKCQNVAFGESVKGEKNPLWKGGLSFEPYCPKFNIKFRERVRAWFDYQCTECGQPQSNKKLCVHHVYYNKQACCEKNENDEYIYTIDGEQVKVIGNPNKFVALCTTCHHKTNYNRVHWARYFEEIINNWYNGRSWLDE
jgi:ribosomal protein L31